MSTIWQSGLVSSAYASNQVKVEVIDAVNSEAYAKAFITKARALSLGNYNHETKEIFIKSGDSEIPYCDVYNGCKKIDNKGEISYVSNLHADSEPGNAEYLLGVGADEIWLKDIVLKEYEEYQNSKENSVLKTR